MPAYNAEKFIAPAIDSILKQTFQDFELIIIDDGSTDNTLDIIKNYAAQDARIRVLQGNHEGLSKACNRGIEESRYEWIARMDADDISLPTRFEKQMAAINTQPEVVAWGTYVHHINSKGEVLSINKLGPTTQEEFYNLRHEGHLAHLHHPTVFLKKEVVLKVGGYRSEFEPAEDLELFDRMSYHGPILAIPEPLLLYRISLQSASMQKFFSQKLMIRYLVARHRHRLENQEELRFDFDFDEFCDRYRNQPLLQRMGRSAKTIGMFFYRKAGLFFGEKYMEVAEHIPARLADSFVNLLCSYSSIIVFSAATPGQGGTDHVNEQPHEYWIEKFWQRGFGWDKDRSIQWRSIWRQKGTASWYSKNLMVFCTEEINK
jgi:glycosyltransferase involved in cell wall biosynthesis